MAWTDLPIDQPLFRNVDEIAAAPFQSGIENAFQTDTKGISRFPGLMEFADLPDRSKVYLHDWNGDLIAATGRGNVFRLGRSGNVEKIEGVPVSGGKRVIFAKSDRELMMAAGGPIVRLRDKRTEILSPDAPRATHVAWLDGITIANEANSGRFYHSRANEPHIWNPLDMFAADGNPDNINSMIVTPFRELMIGGPESIEQYERANTGDSPFFRRWSVGDGVSQPYAMLFADNAVWTINNLSEVVRFSGQMSSAESRMIGRMIERLDDMSDAWMGGYPDKPMHIEGQKFILLQFPNATNSYGTKGVTLVADYANQRWFELFAWDDANGISTRWPGWSHWTIWGDIYVGGEGKVYKLSRDRFTHAGQTQRFVFRTAHIVNGGIAEVMGLRLLMKRGVGGVDTEPTISVRCSRDGGPFGSRITRGMGKHGQTIPAIEFGNFGQGNSFQFEILVTADCPVEIMRAQINADLLEW